MKTLLLLRHAKSSWGEPGLSDHDRPLTERGKLDAPRVGLLIQEQGLTPDLIVCSTAKRARKTAQKVARTCGYRGAIAETETFYLAPVGQYLAYLRQLPDQHHVVLVVGHNPGLEDVLETLTGQVGRLTTAALAQVVLDISGWRELSAAPQGHLVNLWRPNELPASGERGSSAL